MAEKKQKNNKTKEPKKIKVSVIILFVVLILVMLYVGLNYKKIVTLKLNDRVNFNKYLNVDFSQDSIIDIYKNHVLIYENGVLYTIDKSGNISWKEEITKFASPEICVGKNYFLIVDKNTGIYYLYKNYKKVVEGKLSEKINQIAVNKNGNFVFETASKGYKSVISLYNNEGLNLKNYYLMSDTVTNLKLLKDSILFVKANYNGNTINTKLCKIDINDKKLNVKEIKSFDSEIIYGVDVKGSLVNIRTEKGIYEYDLFTKHEKEFIENAQNDILYLEPTQNKIITVKTISNKESKSEQLEIYYKLINYTRAIELSFIPTNLKYQEDLISIGSDKSISLYNNLGFNIKNWSSDAIISKYLIFNNGNSIIAVIANKLYILNL